jgi:aerobic C4-dicarboxylate transport protein
VLFSKLIIKRQMKPLGDAFIKTIKMIIAPIMFCTVVHGIASMQDMKKVGRVGLKALIYFEALTTLALIVGLIVANTLQPGGAMNVDASTIDTRAIQGFVAKSKERSTIQFLMDIIPNTGVGAFAQGEILQVLFFAVLFAFGLQCSVSAERSCSASSIRPATRCAPSSASS